MVYPLGKTLEQPTRSSKFKPQRVHIESISNQCAMGVPPKEWAMCQCLVGPHHHHKMPHNHWVGCLLDCHICPTFHVSAIVLPRDNLWTPHLLPFCYSWKTSEAIKWAYELRFMNQKLFWNQRDEHFTMV